VMIYLNSSEEGVKEGDGDSTPPSPPPLLPISPPPPPSSSPVRVVNKEGVSRRGSDKGNAVEGRHHTRQALHHFLPSPSSPLSLPFDPYSSFSLYSPSSPHPHNNTDLTHFNYHFPSYNNHNHNNHNNNHNKYKKKKSGRREGEGEYRGGRTRFFDKSGSRRSHSLSPREVVRTRMGEREVKYSISGRRGRCVVFFQGPDNLHDGEEVHHGTKYIMRSDVMYVHQKPS